VCSTDTPGGKALWELVQKLWSTKELSRAEAEDIINLLNDRVVTPEVACKLLENSPKAVVLRNVIKPHLSMYLAKNHARQLNVRFTSWRCHDVGKGKKERRLSRAVLQELERQDHTMTGGFDTWMAFFPGCEYIFCNTAIPIIGWANNCTAVGVKLLLDPREKPDDGKGPTHELDYPPLAIIVRPTTVKLGDLFEDENVPSGCFPVVPQTAEPFTVRGGGGSFIALFRHHCH